MSDLVTDYDAIHAYGLSQRDLNKLFVVCRKEMSDVPRERMRDKVHTCLYRESDIIQAKEEKASRGCKRHGSSARWQGSRFEGSRTRTRTRTKGHAAGRSMET